MMISALIVVFKNEISSLENSISLLSSLTESSFEGLFYPKFQFDFFNYANENYADNILEIKELDGEDYYLPISIEKFDKIICVVLTIDDKDFQTKLFSEDWIQYIIKFFSEKFPEIEIYYSIDGDFDFKTREENVSQRKITTHYLTNGPFSVSEYPALLKLYPSD
ncbi:hypothetical protein CNR22_24315 [Sphingobacteriaceae bacterium]|nr:hypothetical protein CNR22_00095 [Sphingobacteriaceae bacterium]PBQ34766.1 hypothetical protein CNR22_24315 [Sphingobacteriaceae bacterium]